MNPRLTIAGLILALAVGAARAQSPFEQLNPPLISPAFAAQPDVATIEAARPGGLKRLDLGGYAILQCGVGDAQALSGCVLLREAPPNNGVGQAALGLAGAYRLDKPRGAQVIFPVIFPPSRQPLDQTASGDAGLVRILGDALAKPQRDGANLTILTCQAMDNGAMSGCTIDYQRIIDPDLAAFYIGQAQSQTLPPAVSPSPRGFQPYYFAYADGAERAEPILVNAPTPDAFYPAGARGVGAVKLSCTVTAQGFAKDCKTESESPQGQGFSAAALEYAGRSTFLPRQIDGANQQAPYAFTVRLAPADEATPIPDATPNPSPGTAP